MATRKKVKKASAPRVENKPRAQIFAYGMRRKRSVTTRIADWLTDSFGTIAFFNWNAALFFGWLIWNGGYFPALPVFDPYPFGMLTMVVSLEAIFLSIIVLISQNRAAKIADVREEIDLQVNVMAEEEVTQILKMLERIEKRLSIKEVDHVDLARMKNVLDLEDLERRVTEGLRG